MKPFAASRWLSVLALTILMACMGLPGTARAANDFSPAEQALFMDKPLAKLQPPLTLQYRFRKSGSLEEAFDDKVELRLTRQADGTCCAVSATFFSGARALSQPDVESAQGNPAILYFLERDIREMERLTQGKANYFRKRIRMAIYQGASIREISLPYQGRQVAVREISISPYLDDPNRPRFEKLADKQYVFMLADSVPGGLYGIRTRISPGEGGAAGAPPLMQEEMLIAAAVVPASASASGSASASTPASGRRP